ncbi:transcriptional regulator [Vibrio sp. JCM 19236]|uniref:helix-turn-helix domain-containing protein n=1 Tax=Vibrio ishigakensis TaxID=1481914 RepID=UPI000591B36C|nr:helix-turn-helix transcriptional regulator [Vibrio ishigakensis]GAM70103.1 transcriptional regulator [Vibrio sp. JCM 19236]
MPSNTESLNLIRLEDMRFFVSLLKQIDKGAYDLLREATIPNDIAGQVSYDYLPESALKNVFELLAKHFTMAELGIIFWRGIREQYIPSVVSQLPESENVVEAVQNLSELLKVISPNSNVYSIEIGGSFWIAREKSEQHALWFKYAELFSILFMVEFVRSLTDMKWMPNQISIVSEDVEIYHSLPTLNGITFIQERSVTGIKLSDDVAKTKPVIKYRRKRALIQAEAIKFKQMDFVSLLKLAIAPYLSGGKLPIKLAAEILRINVRTLQRRLGKEGVIYKELVDDMTFEIIEKELLSSKETITFIASKYGYSDAAHFTRAFKRRYNITPGNFRNKNR